MTIDLSKLKSAVVIDKPDEIEQVLAESHDKSRSEASAFLRDSNSGDSRLEKTVATLARDGAPALPSAEELEALARKGGIEWHPEHAKRVVRYWASDERVDSHGDIVLQNWNFDLFQRNPVLPYGHNWWSPPIGNALQWEVLDRKEGGKGGYKGRALFLLNLFAREEESSEADRVFRLVKSGFLKAGSVGFRSRRVIRIENEDERNELGLGRWGVILDDNQLLEFSVTTLGANHGAMAVLSAAKSKGLVKPDDAALVREIERRRMHQAGSADAWRTLDADWVSMFRTLFPGSDISRHADFDEPIVKGTAPALPQTSRHRDEDVEERLSRIEAALDTMTTGFSSRLDDLRDLVEQALSGLSEGSSGSSSNGAKSGAFETLGDRGQRLLAALDRQAGK